MINLSRIVLVNWYTFSRQDIDLRGSTAIIGPNGSGKSSLLDALQVVLTGNNRNLLALNASSEVTAGRGGRGRKAGDVRSVFQYCLGAINAEILRKECITYLALVFERERDGRTWTAGIGLSASQEDTSEELLGAFIAPDQALCASDFIQTLPGGGEAPIPYEDLLVTLRRHDRELAAARGRKEEFENFPRTTGFTRRLLLTLKGRSSYAEPERFVRTIRNALRFREMDSANQFIRDFILEDDKLDIEGLRRSVATWKGFQERIEQLERQKAGAEDVIADYRELIEKQDDQKRFVWVARKAEQVRTEALLERAVREADAREEEARSAEKTLERVDEAIREMQTSIADIERALASNDKEQALQELQKISRPEAVRIQNEVLGKRSAHLTRLANGVGILGRLEIIPGVDGESYSIAKDRLSALASRVRDGVERDAREVDEIALSGVDPLWRYAGMLHERREELLARLAGLKKDTRELHEQLRGLKAGQAMIRSSTTVLIDTLRRAGIEAKPLAELVEVIDDEWRDAAETMLGAAREALIVAPEHARRATAIMREGRRDFVGCQVVNTTRTGDVDPRPHSDSLAAVIETDDPHARAFVNRRLNAVVRVRTEDELLRVDRGITPDCISAAGGSIEVRRPAASHLLGSDARERNRPILEAAIAEAEREFDRTSQVSNRYAELWADIRSYAAVIGDARLHDIEADVRAATQRVHDIEDNIRTLEGQRPIEIRERLENLRSDLAGYQEERIEDAARNKAAIQKAAVSRQDVDKAREARHKAALDLLAVDAISEDERDSAMRDYRHLLGVLNEPAAVRNEAEREAGAASRRAVQLSGSAPQRAYAFAREFSVDGFDDARPPAEQLAWLEEVLATVEGNQLTRYKESASKARTEMEHALRSDLLIKLYARIQGAERQISDLNRALATKTFHRERYLFDSSPDPSFADIVRVARRAHENADDVMTLFTEGAQVEGDLQRGVAQIRAMLEGGDDVTDIADYRNYLRFELKTKGEDGRIVSDYSRRQRTGSGGEKQVPFYIAISSAVAATCHQSETAREKMGLGLVLFDEAFNALDGGNVNSCLSLMEHFNLQVIVSAPTEKLPNFMEHMDTIVTVNRDRTHCQIDVEYPTRKCREAFRTANPANVPLDLFRDTKAAEDLSDAAE